MVRSNQLNSLRLAFAAVLGVFLVMATRVALGQNAKGTILGHIVDPSGEAIAGAKVTITNQNTNVQSSYVMNASGDYSVL